jgi:creatinine amidohydrolase
MHSSPPRAMSRSFGPRGASVAGCIALALLLLAAHGCASAGTGMSAARAAGAPSDRSAPRSVFLADLTSDELRAAVADGFTTALVYSGGTEGTGPALALGKHNVRAPYYAGRIARELGHALVGQVVPFGVNAEPLAGYPGTIAVRPETFAALHEDIVRSLARAGFRRIVLLTEHGPNVPVLQALAPRLDAALAPTGVRVVLSTDNYTKSAAEIEAWGRARGVLAGRHGGLLDVSELWFVDASSVRPERLALGDTSATPRDSAQQVTGDPRQASAALGRRFADIRVRNAVAEIRRLLGALP